jgi:uncharacterized protein (DUF4415 family)
MKGVRAMAKNKNAVSYTADELRTKVANGEDRTDWQIVDDRIDDVDDEPEWDWSKAEVVIPTSKEQISLRVDADVLAFFKQEGRGYQTRMNAVLRSYMKAHQQRR